MEKFILREWDMTDAAQLAEVCNNKNIARWLRDIFPHPYTFEDAEKYLALMIGRGERRQIARAIVVDEKAVGSITIDVKDDIYRKSAELGYWLAEDFWGHGIMTAAAKQICTMAFEKFDIVRIFATTNEINFASRKVLEKVGFTFEGLMRNSIIKDGKIFSSCMYGLLKNA